MTRKISELTKAEEERALELHRKCIFINCLDATSLFVFDNDLLDRAIKQGGVTAANKTVVGSELQTQKYSRMTMDLSAVYKKFADYHLFFDDYSHRVIQVLHAEDIKRAKKEGKYGIIMGLQGAVPGGGVNNMEHIANVKALHTLGLRIYQLSYNYRSVLADGCVEKADAGLSELGRQVVEYCNKIGIVVDLSHVGYTSTMETIEISKQPVIFSHANAYALYPIPRNKKDDQIKALAKKGGVIGVVGYVSCVSAKDEPTIEDLLDHLDYIVKLVGPDYVGIGLDYPEHYDISPEWKTLSAEVFSPAYGKVGITPGHQKMKAMIVKGLSSFAEFPNITRGLVARGYSDKDIEKILGLNFLRVFEQVWK